MTVFNDSGSSMPTFGYFRGRESELRVGVARRDREKEWPTVVSNVSFG